MAKLNINEAKNNLKLELNQNLTYGAKRGGVYLYSSENINSLEYLTQYGNNEDDIIYVFKSDNKIILTPSDDNFKTILAIFEGDEFDLDKMPPQIKDWFLSYTEQIDTYNDAKNNDSSDDIKYGATTTFVDETIDESYKEDWEDIPEILPYRWGQGFGYSSTYTVCATYHKNYSYNDNMYYEVINDCSIKGETVHVIAGCSVVAAGMVMAYVGQHGINIKKRNGQIENKKYKVGSPAFAEKNSEKKNGIQCRYTALTAIENFEYNFAIAYNRYYKNNKPTSITTTAAQKKNIATFLRYIQQAFNCKVSPQATSATSGYVIKNIKYFNWGKACEEGGFRHPTSLDSYYTYNVYKYGGLLGRGTFNDSYYHTGTDVFETAIYTDLKKGIPVVLYGNSQGSTGKDAEHNFNCDGYQKSTDLWHFNFGWNGQYNGWYSLRSIAANGYNFTYAQMLYTRSYPNEFYNDFIEASKNKIKFTSDSSTTYVKIISHEYINNEFISTSNETWGVDGYTSLTDTTYTPSDAQWLTLSKDPTSTKSNLNISIQPNTTANERTYTITVHKTSNTDIIDTIYIIQEASGTPDIPITYNLTVNPTELVFNSTGGTKTSTITISPADTNWTYEKPSSASWLTITRSNDTTLQFKANANTSTTSDKTCTVTVYAPNPETYKTISIRVKKSVTISVSPTTNVIFNATGGTENLQVISSDPNWSYNIVSSTINSGLTITQSSNTLNIIMTSYNNQTDRTCTLNIHTSDSDNLAETTVTITAKKYVFINSLPDLVEFNADGSTENITINTNDVNWNYTTEQKFNEITITKLSMGLRLVMPSYTVLTDRTMFIKLYTSDETNLAENTITVIAYKYVRPEYTLSISPTSITFNSTGNEISVTVTSNDPNWVIDHVPSWITQATKVNLTTLKVKMNPYTVETDRSDNIILKTSDNNVSITLSVTAQKYLNISSINPQTLEFNPEGGTQYITVTTNDNNWTCNIIDQPSWITATKQNNKVIVTVPPYFDEEDKTCEINIITSSNNPVTKTATVIAKKYLNLEIDPSSVIFEYTGGNMQVNVSTNDEDWSFTTPPNWLEVMKNANSLSLYAEENTQGIDKTGEFDIYTSSNSVTKTLSVSIKKMLYLRIQDNQTTFRIPNGIGITIQVISNANWLVRTTQSFSGLTVLKRDNQTIDVDADINFNTFEKTGKIQVYVPNTNLSINITLIQEKWLELYVNPSIIEFEATGGTLEVGIQTNDDNFSFPTYPTWVNVETNKLASNYYKLIINAYATTIEEAREEVVTFTTSNYSSPIYQTKTLTIKQKAYVRPDYYLNISPTTIEFDDMNQEQIITVSTDDPDWTFEIVEPTYLSGTKTNNTLTITSLMRLMALSKTYVFVKTSDEKITKQITVWLKAYIPPQKTLNVNRHYITFSSKGYETKYVKVISNTDWLLWPGVSSQWFDFDKIDNETIRIISYPNQDNTAHEYTKQIKTTDESKSTYILCTILAHNVIVNTELKLSTEYLILDKNNLSKVISVYSNTIWNMSSIPNWLTIQEFETSNADTKLLTITTNYTESENKESNIIITTEDNVESKTLNIKYIGYIPDESSDEDEETDIGQLVENEYIIISKNGQNMNIKLHGINGENTIIDQSKLGLYINLNDAIIGEIYQTATDVVYPIIIPANNSGADKIYEITGTYLYRTNKDALSNILKFKQRPTKCLIKYIINNLTFDYNNNSVDLKYWVETSTHGHIYDSNITISFITNIYDSTNRIVMDTPVYSVLNNEEMRRVQFNIDTNNTNYVKKLKIEIKYNEELIKDFEITQLTQSVILLNQFDFLTLEYKIKTESNDYISVNDYTNPNQLTKINSYGGEGLQLTAVLSTNKDELPLNKNLNNVITDLRLLKTGYDQEVNGNNTNYSQFLRYSGQNNNGLENESIFINLKEIIKDLPKDITEINIDFYGYWMNTRSTGYTNIILKTYKNDPVNLRLNNYVFNVDNNTDANITDNLKIYDLTEDTKDVLHHTHLFRLNYNIETQSTIYSKIDNAGNYAKNIFIFSPGFNGSYITKYVNRTYMTKLYILPDSGTYKIYLHNSIYQTYNTNQLSNYQVLSEEIIITQSTSIISSINTDSVGTYLQVDAPAIEGIYNIKLDIENLNNITFKVIVSYDIDNGGGPTGGSFEEYE